MIINESNNNADKYTRTTNVKEYQMNQLIYRQ